MIRSIVMAGALAVCAGAALAQSPAIEQRQALMKRIGAATGPIGQMLQGRAPFDLAKVKESLAVYSKEAKAAPALFPDDSKTGGKSASLPAIWEKKAEFNALFAKLDTDAAAALAAITDEASFKANAGKVLGNCAACHEPFRAKQN